LKRADDGPEEGFDVTKNPSMYKQSFLPTTMADLNFDAGYDSASDSGPRANPTASNFEKCEPLKTANDSKAAKPK
jgi:hypothetical protein